MDEEEIEECNHEEHDHNICLYCGKDILDHIIDAAKYLADSLADR